MSNETSKATGRPDELIQHLYDAAEANDDGHSAECGESINDAQLCARALVAERDGLRTTVSTMRAALNERVAERDRLKAALERIANDLQAWESMGGSRDARWPSERIKAARAALEGGGR